MAGFFKKVFSFGRKEVEQRPVADEPLAPIDWAALKALRDEAPARADVAPADPEPTTVPAAELAPPPAVEAEKPALPPAPEPVEAPAAETVAAPETEILPPLRQPSPIEAEPVFVDEIAPEPQAVPDVDIAPAPPVEAEEPAALPAPEPAKARAVEATEPELAPEAEVLPPLRQPSPIMAEPDFVADIAPEPQAVPDVEIAPAPAVEAEKPAAPPAPEPAEAPAVEAVEPEAAPEAGVLPPLRQPSPIESDPVFVDEIAPEPQAVPEPPSVEARLPGIPVATGTPQSPATVPPQDDAAAPAVPAPPASVAPADKATAGKVTVARKVEQRAEPVAPVAPEPKLSWFQRLRQGLARSSRELSGSIAGVFTKRKLDEDTLQDLEDVLIRADLGVETALRVTDSLAASRYGKDVSDADVRGVMATEIEKVLAPVALPLELDLSHKPHVILVVGVNGTGKTTTIGKLAAKLTDGGLSVMLAAGDTFRAAAIEQLKIWGERTKSPVVSSKIGADAAGLAYDAFEQAKAAGSDVLIVDTAGRLQNRTELMDELEKIVRVLGKLDPEAPHTVLQTVDATTGQNALNQVEIFRNVAGVNGLVMTKLDGTARGGILVAIAAKHKLPVYFIGVGEQVDDLEPFSANEFARAIAGVG